MTLVPPTDLPPVPPEVPGPRPADLPRNIVCEFCECTLTPHGHALKMSDAARLYRDQKDLIATLRTQIKELEELQTSITRDRDDAQRALREAQAAQSDKRIRW